MNWRCNEVETNFNWNYKLQANNILIELFTKCISVSREANSMTSRWCPDRFVSRSTSESESRRNSEIEKFHFNKCFQRTNNIFIVILTNMSITTSCFSQSWFIAIFALDMWNINLTNVYKNKDYFHLLNNFALL